MLVLNLLWGKDVLLMVGNYTFFSKEIHKSDFFFLGKAAVPLSVVKWLFCFRASLQKHCLEPERSERWQRNYWAEVPLETSKVPHSFLRESAHLVPGTLGNIQWKQRYSRVWAIRRGKSILFIKDSVIISSEWLSDPAVQCFCISQALAGMPAMSTSGFPAPRLPFTSVQNWWCNWPSSSPPTPSPSPHVIASSFFWQTQRGSNKTVPAHLDLRWSHSTDLLLGFCLSNWPEVLQ